MYFPTVMGSFFDTIHETPIGELDGHVRDFDRFDLAALFVGYRFSFGATCQDEESADQTGDDSELVHTGSVPHFTMGVDRSNRIRQR